jgi:hypothetical protein
MASEFEKHIAMDPDKIEGSEESGLIARTKDQIGETAQAARDTVRENAGTITTTALLFGVAGFAIGWAYGQSSARSERYWY